MPRKKQKKYTEEDLKTAVEEVWAKRLTISAAAKCFQVPRTTLADHVHRRRVKVGASRPTILTQVEEKELVVACQVLQRMVFLLTRDILTMVVQDYLTDHPERGRHFDGGGPTLHLESLSVQCAKSGTRENLDEWYEKVKDFFEEVKLTRRGRPCRDFSHRLWNCDETGFCLGVTAKTILVKKGAKFVHDTSGGSDRSHISVHCCGSASGIRLPLTSCTKASTYTRIGQWRTCRYSIRNIRFWLDGEEFHGMVQQGISPSCATSYTHWSSSSLF